MAKSRSWTFPAYPSPAVAVAPLPFAGCQPSFLARLCLTFVCAAGGEAASPREEDSDAGGGDDVEGEEVGPAVLEVQYSVLEVLCGFLEVQCIVTEVHCSSLEVQYSEREQLPLSASPH